MSLCPESKVVVLYDETLGIVFPATRSFEEQLSRDVTLDPKVATTLTDGGVTYTSTDGMTIGALLNPNVSGRELYAVRMPPPTGNEFVLKGET
jgi:hypothetical protein